MTKRPTRHDDAVQRIAAERVLEMLRKAYPGEGFGDSDLESLISAMDRHYDGYKIARELESDGWDPDEEMVEILGRAAHEVDKARDELIRAWVKENDIQPKIAVGAQVRWSDAPFKKEWYTGEIVKIEADLANYWVFSPELGHVRRGEWPDAIILPYERVEAA